MPPCEEMPPPLKPNTESSKKWEAEHSRGGIPSPAGKEGLVFFQLYLSLLPLIAPTLNTSGTHIFKPNFKYSQGWSEEPQFPGGIGGGWGQVASWGHCSVSTRSLVLLTLEEAGIQIEDWSDMEGEYKPRGNGKTQNQSLLLHIWHCLTADRTASTSQSKRWWNPVLPLLYATCRGQPGTGESAALESERAGFKSFLCYLLVLWPQVFLHLETHFIVLKAGDDHVEFFTFVLKKGTRHSR